MTDLTLAVRLTADGSGFVGAMKISRAELEKLGQGTAQTGRAMAQARDETGRFARTGEQAARSTANLTRYQLGLGNAAASAVPHLKSLLATYLSFEAARRVLADTVRETVNAEKVSARLDAVLRATGNAAGYTRDQLEGLIDSMAGRTLFDDDTIRQGIAVLATFRAVQGDAFREGIELAGDLAALLGTDLQSAVLQIGKALENPEEGLTALRRSGVSFNETQREMILRLNETGRAAEAQRIILDGIRGQLGGTAAAQNVGLAGAIAGVTKAWNDMLEAFGRTPAVQGTVNPVLKRIRDNFKDIEGLLAGARPSADALATELENVNRALARIDAAAAAGGARDFMQRLFATGAASRDALLKRREELEIQLHDLRRPTAEAQRNAYAGNRPPARTVELSSSQRDALRALELEASLIDKARVVGEQAKALKGAGFEPIVSALGDVTVKDFEKLDPVFQRAIERIKEYTAAIDKARNEDRIATLSRETASFDELAATRTFDPEGRVRSQARRRAEEIAGAEKIGDKAYIARLTDAIEAHELANRKLQDMESLYSELRGPQEDFARRSQAIATEFRNGGISADEARRAIRSAYTDMLDASREWEDGVKRGLLKVADEYGDLARSFENTTVGAFKKGEDAWLNWAKTGKLAAGDLFDFLGDEMLRLAYRALLVKPFLEPLADGLSGFAKGLFDFGGGAGPGMSSTLPYTDAAGFGVGHEGGQIGGPNAFRTKAVPPSVFENAPRFHTGTPSLAPDEVPFIGKKGEVIGWPDQLRRAFGGSDTLVQIVDQRGAGAPTIETQRSTGPDGRQVIRALVRREVKTAIADGAFDTDMRQNFGTSRVPATRRS